MVCNQLNAHAHIYQLEVAKLIEAACAGHTYCRSCLRGALKHSRKCPKCREKIPSGMVACILARLVIQSIVLACLVPLPYVKACVCSHVSNAGPGIHHNPHVLSTDADIVCHAEAAHLMS